MERPKIVSKLATYIQDKEPLVYLFIINSDFILDDDEKVLPSYGLAGVMVKNRRILFYYRSEVLKLSKEKLYFLILHEAFHVFKKHLQRHEDLAKENMIMLNIATDAIINEEIKELPITYELKPELIDESATIPKEYKDEHHDLQRQAYTTRRLYHWFKNRKLNKKQLMQKGSFVKQKNPKGGDENNEYGRITEVKSDGTYDIDKMSRGEMFEEMINGDQDGKKEKGGSGNFTEDELIPVVQGSKTCGGVKLEDGTEAEVINTDSIDAHLDGSERNIDQEVIAKKLFEKAKEMQKVIDKRAGNQSGNFTSKIEELYKSKVNWRRELNRHLNLYYSNNCSAVKEKPSFITYPWNPKSRYGILCKHRIQEIVNLQKYVIIAMDTSGSVFFDRHDMRTFFTEIDAMAKWLNFSNEGSVMTLQWDAKVQEGLREYKKGFWKRFKTKGGGGTIPQNVFKYLTNIYKPMNGHYYIKEEGFKMIIPNKRTLPFIVFLTDGYFFNKLKRNDLGVYKDSEKSILFLTRDTSYLYKDARSIVYE